MQKPFKKYFYPSRHFWMILLIYWISLIFYLSNQSYKPVWVVPPSAFNLIHEVRDEWPEILAHMTEYTVLTTLFAVNLSKFSRLNRQAIILWAILIVFLFSLSDEFHQSFIPGRNCSLFDIVCDSIGILIGTMIYKKIYDKRKT
ncbi:MAG: VanZ family protein [Candidatus Falkowbacteria bacterium]|nr:VanZ family protein [Candidatus Falkowbacteria bacterium]